MAKAVAQISRLGSGFHTSGIVNGTPFHISHVSGTRLDPLTAFLIPHGRLDL